MKQAFIAALFICSTAYAVQHFENGSVLLERNEADYVAGVVNNLTEKVVLQDIRIKELESQLKAVQNAKCL